MKQKSPCASDLVYTQQFILSTLLVKEVVEMFKGDSSNFYVVTENHMVAGIIGREKLSHHMSARYGWALYSDKSVVTLMDRNPLVLDGQTDAMDVLRHVVARPTETIYDDVIICSENSYAGLISVKRLMVAQLETLEKQLIMVEQQRSLLEKTIATHLLDQNANSRLMSLKVDAIVEAAQEMEKAERDDLEQAQKNTALPSSMHGELGSFSTIDLVQLLVQGGKTGLLRLNAGNKEDSQHFEVYLLHGKIVNASGAGDVGMEALWKALRLNHGAFKFNFGVPSDEITIDENPMGILLEACRRQDEVTVPI